MRVNVYYEEQTPEIEMVEKRDVVGEDGQLTTFYGIRFYLASSELMHQTPTDDDRSTVTFWWPTASHPTPTPTT
jgi:hypothetical protein